MAKERVIEVFVSKRLRGFPRKRLSIDCDGVKYQLSEKTESDGWLYEIPATDLRVFPAVRYPNMKFVYTRYHIESIKSLDYMTIERLKTEETVRFNKDWSHSVYTVSTIVDEVYKYIKSV